MLLDAFEPEMIRTIVLAITDLNEGVSEIGFANEDEAVTWLVTQMRQYDHHRTPEGFTAVVRHRRGRPRIYRLKVRIVILKMR